MLFLPLVGFRGRLDYNTRAHCFWALLHIAFITSTNGEMGHAESERSGNDGGGYILWSCINHGTTKVGGGINKDRMLHVESSKSHGGRR